MDSVAAALAPGARARILDRRQRLEAAAAAIPAVYLTELLAEVDAALARINDGTYGRCEACHDPIEADRLVVDPLTRFCVDHLTAPERRAHEDDLALAAKIQQKLLPSHAVSIAGWEADYAYQAAGPVGGDYCELATFDGVKSLFFAVGDVAGKGVAASLLMTHLSAIVRSLLSLHLPLPEVMRRANRLFCEATLSSHYATLACGRIVDGQRMEVSNAGHCSPLVVRGGKVERLEASGLPLGLFCQSDYSVEQLELAPGETLVLYSDGVTEAHNPQGDDFGEEHLIRALYRCATQEPTCLSRTVLEEVEAFRGGAAPADDVTLLAIQRVRQG